MKSTGIVRGIDALGRIVLPKELRKTLQIETDTQIEIFVDGETVLLKKYQSSETCVFCGTVAEDGIPFEGKCICKACKEKLATL